MSGPDARDVARLLRQRVEMGASALFLDATTREDFLALASQARDPAPAPMPAGEPERPRSAPERTRTATTPASSSGAGKKGGELPVLPGAYGELREAALACTRCRLSEARTNVVFSDGVVDARLVVVGEAPGANEDATGLPFVGAAGQFLDLLLACVDLSREESVYICNVLKCRPPGNRNPLPDEIEACSPFLKKQLELIAPRALLAVGTFAAQALTGEQKPLGKLRGQVHGYQGIPLVVTYHPAALLRNPGWTRAVWDDLQLLRDIMDGA